MASYPPNPLRKLMAGYPHRQGLYDPRREHDACGIGFVAHIRGLKSHEIVEQALTVLCNLDHRGARGCETNIGDGGRCLATDAARIPGGDGQGSVRDSAAEPRRVRSGHGFPAAGRTPAGCLRATHGADRRRRGTAGLSVARSSYPQRRPGRDCFGQRADYASAFHSPQPQCERRPRVRAEALRHRQTGGARDTPQRRTRR